MKRLFTLFALFAALLLDGAETLRIADATGSDGDAITGVLFSLNAERPQLELSLRKIDAESAWEKFEAGDFDIVLVNGDDLPQKFRPAALRYSTGAFIAAVNVRNPFRSMKLKDLRLLLDTPRPHWELVGGSASEIHRLAVTARNGEIAGAKLLKLDIRARDMLTFPTVGEAVILAEGDPAALVWGPFTSALPLTVIALEIDGIAPTRANIRSGRYPLSISRFAVGTPRPNDAARRFLELLRSGEAAGLLEADGEIPELPDIRRSVE